MPAKGWRKVPKKDESAVSHDGTGTLDARLALYNAGEWTPGGRKEIANWLRREADQLELQGQHYGECYMAKREH